MGRKIHFDFGNSFWWKASIAAGGIWNVSKKHHHVAFKDRVQFCTLVLVQVYLSKVGKVYPGHYCSWLTSSLGIRGVADPPQSGFFS